MLAMWLPTELIEEVCGTLKFNLLAMERRRWSIALRAGKPACQIIYSIINVAILCIAA
ncbi:MAG: hypothetical protein GPOALKHO_000877 [Sodalis sp.]|nr:MAG: hypothetical protein GPOALKHO_000877 [Sodalis sp.]